MGCITHEQGRKAKEEKKTHGFPKLAFFLPAFVCLLGAPKRVIHFPRVVGIPFLFRSSISSKHATVNGVNTNKNVLLNLWVFVWLPS